MIRTALGPDVVVVLARALRRARRVGHRAVGTEHLLVALIDEGVLAHGGLRAHAAARGENWWAGPDGGAALRPGGDVRVVAALREAAWVARSPLPATDGLVAVLESVLGEVAVGGAGARVVAASADLARVLLRVPGTRVAELLVERRVDVGALRPRPLEVEAPTVALLRKAGLLSGRGTFPVRLLTRWMARGGGPATPVLLAVRSEARRQAVRAGRGAVGAADLLAAVLAVDDLLDAAGERLPAEVADGNDAGAVLRAHGVDLARFGEQLWRAEAEPVGEVEMDAGAERVLAAASLVAATRGAPAVTTTHLLVALLDDPADPVGPLLARAGADVAAVRGALG